MTSTPVGSSGPKRPNRSLTSRTSLLTAAAVAGVLLAGTAAVAANIGILDAADSSAIGDLAATDELLPTVSTTAANLATGAQSAPATTAATPGESTAQQYDISGAGTVWVMTTTSGVALDHVVAEAGWNATLTQSDPGSLQVNFTNGDRTIVFTASIGSGGALVVDVTEPTTVLAETPAAAVVPPAAAAPYDDDEYDDEYDDEEYEEEYEEHEGAEDDD